MRSYLINGIEDVTIPAPKPRDGCCSWDGKKNCGATTDYCEANKNNCENDCHGLWMNLQGEAPETPQKPEEPETPQKPEEPETPQKPEEPETPQKPEEPEKPVKTYDCCSWNGGQSCGNHSDWCNISKKNCKRFCSGTWISAPGEESEAELAKKEDRLNNCCSWDNGETCPAKEKDFCNGTKKIAILSAMEVSKEKFKS